MSFLATAISTGTWGGDVRDRPETGEETRLLAALAAGDRSAAERLVERTYRGVFSLLRRLSGDAELAADLTQETYRKAWAALPGFDRRAQFSTWLFRIAYTTFLNHVRRPRRLVPLEEKHEATVADPAPAADEMVGQGMEGDRLRRAVLALPDELRYLVTAVFWGDLPVKEIALQEGITPVAIRKRLKKAFRLLALSLEEDAR
ncbi:MAG TPA: RNA polymerase sigma factor [Thermoanaerobaculia bacterium]|jgi:RNA polymerase sigma-70 factor (ECF subfamily)|nr:RNA polymerase sigma factor [Thermoanaerobaculia bacterium]